MSGLFVTRLLAAMALLCLVAIGVLWTSGIAVAQQGPQCAPHDEIVKGLLKQYQEVRQSIGLVNDKAMVEVFVSPKGTWTWVATTQDRVACIVAAGDNWEFDLHPFDALKKKGPKV